MMIEKFQAQAPQFPQIENAREIWEDAKEIIDDVQERVNDFFQENGLCPTTANSEAATPEENVFAAVNYSDPVISIDKPKIWEDVPDCDACPHNDEACKADCIETILYEEACNVNCF